MASPQYAMLAHSKMPDEVWILSKNLHSFIAALVCDKVQGNLVSNAMAAIPSEFGEKRLKKIAGRSQTTVSFPS